MIFPCYLTATVMCLSIGTPKNSNVSICSKRKFNYFKGPRIWANYSLIDLNIATPETINFPFGTNGKSMILSVPMGILQFSISFLQIKKLIFNSIVLTVSLQIPGLLSKDDICFQTISLHFTASPLFYND